MQIKNVVCIGGANIDIQGFPFAPIKMRDSNPGRLEISPGGVARNIAENLARMGIPLSMLSVVGDDLFGGIILDSCRDAGIDTSGMDVIPGMRSSAYLALTDTDGDMLSAVSDMRILKQMGAAFVLSHQAALKEAGLIVVDPNLSRDALEALFTICAGKPIFADPISTSYAALLKEFIPHLYWIKANTFEAEVLSGQSIRSEDELLSAAAKILQQGIKRLTITMGKRGVLYMDQTGLTMRRPAFPTPVVNATGAGDAFTAGLVFSYLHEFEIADALDFAMAAASITISHIRTVNPEISEAGIRAFLERGSKSRQSDYKGCEA